MTVSGRSAVVGLGRQVAEGTALTVPKYEIAMGAGMVGPERSTAELPWTSESQDSVGDFVERASGLIEVTVPLLPRSSVTVLQSILGARATTGVDPFTHVITPADSLAWFTWFFAQPGGNYWTLADAKSGSYELSWSPGQPLEASVAGLGKTPTRAAAKWGAAAVEEDVDPFFTYIGATMKLDHSSTPATTQVRNIAGGSISVNRNLEGIQTDGLGWEYVAEQKRDIEISLDDVVFEDNDFINTIFTGSTSGTGLSGATVYGSAEFLFLGSDEAAAALRSLKIAVPEVLWAVDRIPGANPDGSTTRYTVTGRASKPASGASITATVINADAGTNY